MIFGIGIDLIDVDRIEKEIHRHGDSFLNRIFTDGEIRYCNRSSSKRVRSQCFSSRFAAKEAFLKAAGTGLRNGLGWKDIEVSNNELGKPCLILKNMAEKIIKKNSIERVHLSITHINESAAAVVILEKRSGEK